MKLIIGSDHRGFHLKNAIKAWCLLNNIDVDDIGAKTLDETDDYPVYGIQVARQVSATDSLGVVLCGSGTGMVIVGNKVEGVRCSLGINKKQIIESRADDNINMLALAADVTEQKAAIGMVEAFVKTAFVKNERHIRRLNEIEKIEKGEYV